MLCIRIKALGTGWQGYRDKGEDWYHIHTFNVHWFVISSHDKSSEKVVSLELNITKTKSISYAHFSCSGFYGGRITQYLPISKPGEMYSPLFKAFDIDNMWRT